MYLPAHKAIPRAILQVCGTQLKTKALIGYREVMTGIFKVKTEKKIIQVRQIRKMNKLVKLSFTRCFMKFLKRLCLSWCCFLSQWVLGVSTSTVAFFFSQSKDKALAAQSVADQESQECGLSKQRNPYCSV